jgi:hypothetical protein
VFSQFEIPRSLSPLWSSYDSTILAYSLRPLFYVNIYPFAHTASWEFNFLAHLDIPIVRDIIGFSHIITLD